MNKIVNGVANDFEFETLTRWQDPTIDMLKKEVEEYKEILNKIKKYINEEKEEYEKGQLLYKDFGRELEQYMKGQLVAYKHIEKILKGSDNNDK